MTSEHTIDAWDGIDPIQRSSGVSQQLFGLNTRKQYTFQFYAAPGQISGSCDIGVIIDTISAGGLHFDSTSSGSGYILFQMTRTLSNANPYFGVGIKCKGPSGTTGQIFLDDFQVWADNEQEACPVITD